MRLLLKILKGLGIGFAILLVLIFLFKDLVIKTVIMDVGSTVLGAKLEIGQFAWGIFSQKVIIKDLKIEDPQGFEKLSFVDIPQITLQYDLPAMLKGRMHMPLVWVDLKEMVVVKNNEGKLNVDALKVLHPQKQEKAKIPPFQIDVLKLNVGHVIFKDYFRKTPPEILVYDVQLKDRTFKDVNSIEKLVTVILVQAMKQTAIQGAGIYAAAAVLGVGFLPAAVLGAMVAKDDAVAEFSAGYDKVFSTSENFIREKGLLKSSDKEHGAIQGTVEGTAVNIKLERLSMWKTRLTVSARRFMLPRREFAGGILYQISQRL